MKKPSRAALEFGLACLGVIGSSLVVFNTRRSDSARPHIEISGALAEYEVIGRRKSPALRPMLDDDVEIAWVHGLNVGGEKIFGLTHVEAWEQKNRRWGYALFLGALATAGYLGVKWHRISGNKRGD
jgi:hypothetical protein